MNRILLLVLIFLAACTPKNAVQPNHPIQPKMQKKAKNKAVILGVENFLDNYLHLVKGKRVGLVTNASGVNSKLQSTADLFYSHPDINLTALFGPEHGIRGDIFAGDKVADQVDPRTGIPVFSLYGKHRAPTEEMYSQLDIIFFDIQDVGVRSYTYISTMGKIVESAAKYGKEVVVLDRPNPIGGSQVEGNIVHEGYFSMIGYFPIAYRHGMTVGELALMHNKEQKLNAKLTVIPVKNWKRDMYWDETGLPWVPTSPHIPNWESILFMTATGTIGSLQVLSEGVGYTAPFQLVGAEWVDANQFAAALNKLNLPGVIFRPTYFRPYYFRLKDTACQGVQLHITNKRTFKPFITGLHIINTSRTLYPEQTFFVKNRRVSAFNKVMGHKNVTEQFQNGKSVAQMEAFWQSELKSFLKIRQKYLLY